MENFAVAGEDKKWVWADARIEGDTVVVSSDDVKKPVAVRYGFTMNPGNANLYNKDGIAALRLQKAIEDSVESGARIALAEVNPDV